MHLEQNAQFLLVLGLALVFEDVKCLEKEVIVAYGSVAVLPCKDESPLISHPSTVYWTRTLDNVKKTVWRREKNGLEFRSVNSLSHAYCPTPNFGKGDYSLHIAGITDEDGGSYTCEVKGKSLMMKHIMLRVIKVSLSPTIVVEGLRVDARCDINPKPHRRIQWELNGKAKDRTVIYRVSQSDSGNWTCRVSYDDVVGEAAAVLQVRGISRPSANSSMVYAAVGSFVTLPCVFTEGLVQSSAIWERRNNSLPSSFQQPFMNFSSPYRSAWIDTVKDGDEGIYTCLGRMQLMYGEMKVQRSMQLVVARVLSSESKGQKTLTCQLSDSSQVTSYEWLHVTNGVNNTQTVTSVSKSQVPSFKIPKARNQDSDWMCLYYGKDRLLGNVSYHVPTTGAQTGQSNSSSGNKVGMVMGLGFLFLVVVLVLFQMYKNYRRKKRILLFPAMETIVHEAATERERSERCQSKLNDVCVSACV